MLHFVGPDTVSARASALRPTLRGLTSAILAEAESIAPGQISGPVTLSLGAEWFSVSFDGTGQPARESTSWVRIQTHWGERKPRSRGRLTKSQARRMAGRFLFLLG